MSRREKKEFRLAARRGRKRGKSEKDLRGNLNATKGEGGSLE